MRGTGGTAETDWSHDADQTARYQIVIVLDRWYNGDVETNFSARYIE